MHNNKSHYTLIHVLIILIEPPYKLVINLQIWISESNFVVLWFANLQLKPTNE